MAGRITVPMVFLSKHCDAKQMIMEIDQSAEVKLQVDEMSHVISMADDVSDEPTSPSDAGDFDDSDLLSGGGIPDDVTAQLVAAGPIGVAAAAAIATGKKRKRPHSFETNPAIRKRQATRLLRKLKQVIDEFTTRVGQQACVVVCCPGKVSSSFKVFGAAPLENVLRSCKSIIMQDLDLALQKQAPPPPQENSGLHELPPLVVEGIPTPVDKMTQAQLRAFIPVMLKYSTGRGKPGWGKDNTRPPWWPDDVPWANVRSDVRMEDMKAKVSWTNALRKIVKNCYKYHGREDLLIEFSENDQVTHQQHQQPTQQYVTQGPYPHMVHTINNADGTLSIIQVDASGTVTTISEAGNHTEATQAVATLAEVAAASQGDGGMIHIHQAGLQNNSEAAQAAVNTITEATIQEGGQILLGDAVSAAAALVGVQNGSGVVSIPVQAAAAMMQIQGGSIIPMSSGTTVQFISTSSVPQVAMTAATMTTTTPVSSNGEFHHIHITSETADGVPVAAQAVEVVTIAEGGATQ